MKIAYALGRIFVPIVFIWEAILKLINIGRFAKLLADSKVPVPDEIAPYLGGMPKYEALAWALAVLELVCGLMILTGLMERWGALLLVVFTAGTIFFVHNFWVMTGDAYEQNLIQALKNLSIIGGLLLIAVGRRAPDQASASYFGKPPR